MKRYVLQAEKPIVEEIFDVQSDSESLFEPNYNVIPGTSMPVVVKKGESREIRSSVWGLSLKERKQSEFELPHEEILEQDDLAALAKKSPCIVPASGFYKWKESVKDPLPFYLRILTQEVCGIAGICSSYKNKEGREIHTFAVLTMKANPLVEPLDNRMPVILSVKDHGRWLNGNAPEMLAKGFSGNHLLPDMAVFRVPELVNDPSINSKELIQPIPKLRNYDGEEEE